MRPISIEKLEQDVQGMPNGKAPGLDGFTMYLFKASWDIVGLEIHEVV